MSEHVTTCPFCGYEPALPTITPEMLYFRSTQTETPKLGAVMPDGSYAVGFAGVIYSMPPDQWVAYEAMTRASETLDRRFLPEAA